MFPTVPFTTEQYVSFIAKWETLIRQNDLVFWAESEQEVWAYLLLRLRDMLGHTRSIGQAGWTFWRTLQSGEVARIARVLIWADPTSSSTQETPFTGNTGAESWWPAIIVDDGGDVLAVYCPGLAWAKARPWYVHRSRVFVLDGEVHVLPSTVTCNLSTMD